MYPIYFLYFHNHVYNILTHMGRGGEGVRLVNSTLVGSCRRGSSDTWTEYRQRVRYLFQNQLQSPFSLVDGEAKLLRSIV